jgi:hypothetical protein
VRFSNHPGQNMTHRLLKISGVEWSRDEGWMRYPVPLSRPCSKGQEIQKLRLTRSNKANQNRQVSRRDRHHRTFQPDVKYSHSTFRMVIEQLWNYAWLNAGLKLRYNGKIFQSRDGLFDLLTRKTTGKNCVTRSFIERRIL